jgi:hypothetical protein
VYALAARVEDARREVLEPECDSFSTSAALRDE